LRAASRRSVLILLCLQWETPDDGQGNCPKHVEFHSKIKFEKLVHLVGFIIRIYHDARSPEPQIEKPNKLKRKWTKSISIQSPVSKILWNFSLL